MKKQRSFTASRMVCLLVLLNVITGVYRVDVVVLDLDHEAEGHWSDPNAPPLCSGYETDESTSSVGSFRTCCDGDARV